MPEPIENGAVMNEEKTECVRRDGSVWPAHVWDLMTYECLECGADLAESA